MYRCWLIFIIGCQFGVCLAQPDIEWQKTLGGSAHDSANKVLLTKDGGSIVVGYSFSSDGDKTEHIANSDGWIVKLDSLGAIEWQKSVAPYPWSGYNDVEQTSDGSFIACGSANRNVNNSNYATGWLAKWSKTGELLWLKNLSFFDSVFTQNTLIDLVLTPDNNILAVGNHDYYSSDQVYENDLFLIKFDTSGNIQWYKDFGGSDRESGTSICRTINGDYLIAGQTASFDGDVNGNHGGIDIWVLKVDSVGALIWQKCLGGSSDDAAFSISQATNSQFLITGVTRSVNGDITWNHGGNDIWVINIDENGLVIWEKTFGGTKEDIGYFGSRTPDGNYIIVGSVKSTDGDIIGHHGGEDGWLAKIDDNGNILWQRCLGGSKRELIRTVATTSNGNILLAGLSESIDGDLTENKGIADYWLISLSNTTITESTTLNYPAAHALKVYPNPAFDNIILDIEEAFPLQPHVEVTDILGEVVISDNLPSDNVIDVTKLAPGIYNLKLHLETGVLLTSFFLKL